MLQPWWTSALFATVLETSPTPGVLHTNATFAVVNETNITYAQGQVCASSNLPQTNCTSFDLLLDVYTPVGGGTTKRPAYILSHGGGNTGGSKEQYCFQGAAAFYAARGFVAFNIDYRLSGQHGRLPRSTTPTPGTALVASSATETVWWPHPPKNNNASRSAGAAPVPNKTTVIRYGSEQGTLCITPWSSAPPKDVVALVLEPCGTAGSAMEKSQLWTTGSVWGIKSQRFIHNATGLCMTLLDETAGASLAAAPCSSTTTTAAAGAAAMEDQIFQLGFSGRLFNSHTGGDKIKEFSIAPESTAALATATSSGWNPKWASGYPAVRDLKAAIRWVRANAEKYNVDPTRVVVSGGSAGATNSLAAGVTFDGDYRDEVSAMTVIMTSALCTLPQPATTLFSTRPAFAHLYLFNCPPRSPLSLSPADDGRRPHAC